MKLFLAASLLLFPFAHGAGVDQKECKTDIEKFCKGVEPGQRRVFKCLMQNKDSLSPACSAKMETAKKEIKEAAQACRADKKKFCKNVKMDGKGAVRDCLQKNEAKLSAECKKEIQDVKDLHSGN